MCKSGAVAKHRQQLAQVLIQSFPTVHPHFILLAHGYVGTRLSIFIMECPRLAGLVPLIKGALSLPHSLVPRPTVHECIPPPPPKKKTKKKTGLQGDAVVTITQWPCSLAPASQVELEIW